MTINILPPNPLDTRPFWQVTQLTTQAWGYGTTEQEAIEMMRQHPKYKFPKKPKNSARVK